MASQALARAIDTPRTLQSQAQSRGRGVQCRMSCEKGGCYCENHNPISVAQSETLQHARLGYANPLECHEGRYAPPQLLHYTAAEARLAARARRWRWSHTLAREVLRERGVLVEVAREV